MTDPAPTDDQQAPVELQRETATEPATPAESLTESQRHTLFRLLRVAYPHPDFPDEPYQRTAQAVEDAGGELAEGLDKLAADDFDELSDEDATAAIERIADTEFFALIHATTVVALYDDHQVWELLGYEGPSFDKGGYLHRGFDDLDWLPAARITEYEGEPRPELVSSSTDTGER